MKPADHITVTDDISCIRVNVIRHEDDDLGRLLEDAEEIAVIQVSPYLTGPEARGLAERIAHLASVNLSDDYPLGVSTNY